MWKIKTKEALDQIAYLQELLDQTRLRLTDGYPYFLLWGLLWILGYLGSIWWSPSVWEVIAPVGGVLTAIILLREKKGAPLPPFLKKIGWLMIILCVYIGLLYALFLMVLENTQVLNSFWPFHIGLLYVTVGIFGGRQIILIGGWLILVAIAGIWLPSPIQEIWLAGGGGGSLILTGLIFRKHVIKNA